MEGDGFSLGYAMGMMMIDAVIYGILTWYIEAVLPGEKKLMLLYFDVSSILRLSLHCEETSDYFYKQKTIVKSSVALDDIQHFMTKSTLGQS